MGDATAMRDKQVIMYSTRFCPYCIRARMLLENKQVPFDDIAVDANPALREEMMRRSARRTVPQIWIGERHVGGYDDLLALERSGSLDELLQAVQQRTA